MEINTVKIENPDGLNMILGHTHFMRSKTEHHGFTRG